jgi:hypothetical protein
MGVFVGQVTASSAGALVSAGVPVCILVGATVGVPVAVAEAANDAVAVAVIEGSF